ncbi:hypothetical protein HC864_03965 [Candidatus Gracilibacteria bacterium]|nr:hypothetical protein [Candidatus Gracilibacteria bacterium]
MSYGAFSWTTIEIRAVGFDPEEVCGRFQNIVCGDFNIYANPKYNWMIWWMMGFSPKEIFTNERDEFEKVFRSNNLDNPLKNKQTFAQRNLQLDHIIVPKKLKTNSTVIDNLYGSDHYPILVEFKFG